MFPPDGKGRLDCDTTQNSDTFLKQPPVSEFLSVFKQTRKNYV